MARNVFYSFHYKPDNWRASTVRSIGAIEGNRPARDNEWETITNGGDAAIRNWIDGQMRGRSCTIVLIGAETARRKWIDYEITKSWADKKGLLGIYVHNIRDAQGKQSAKGANPFAHIQLPGGRNISSYAVTYESPYQDSKMAYGYIADNLEGWIEAAIRTRAII